jgi:hypothetical protein
MRKMTQRIATVLGAALLVAVPVSAQVVVEADAGEEQLLECSAEDGTSYQLYGLGSSVEGRAMDDDTVADPNPYKNDVTYLWEAVGVDFDDDTSATPIGTFPLGPTTVELTFTYTDPISLEETSSIGTVEIVVGDINPPTVTGVSDPVYLWPPNHKLHEVNMDLVVMDSCDPDPTVTLISLISSEPDNGQGDGNTVNDIQEADLGTDDRTFLLRAERMGGGTGRIYTAIYNATDASGNATDGEIEILVPHDQGDMKAAKAAAKAAEKMAKAAERAASKADKQAAKAAAKAARQAAKAAKQAAKQ